MPTVQDVDRALARTSLMHFIRQAWRTVETDPFTDGWHLEVLVEHLEAVTRGQIKRLLINVPPRHMKSLAVSVFWPAWDWLQDPKRRWLFASYAASLSIRDSVRCRRVISSPWYQRLLSKYQPDLVLTGDQNTKTRFDNSLGGYRIATSVEGALTGEGGDRIIVDDPHNVIEGESETKRDGVLRWWDEALSTRLSNPETGAYVIIMQRVHERDLTGHVMAKDAGWDYLCLPARYEGLNRSQSSLGFTDPRTEPGEPLWPERYGEEALDALERDLGPYAAAAQLQQRPAPRGGGMFPVDKFRFVTTVLPTEVLTAVRYWDKAGTAGGTGARTAGALMGQLREGRWALLDMVAGRWEARERENRIKQTAERDRAWLGTNRYTVWTEQEPGSGGKESAEATIRNLVGYKVFADRVTGDKATRAEPYAAQVQGGNVWVVVGPWNAECMAEHEMFPVGERKDMVDAAAGAFNKLVASAKKAGTW